MNQWKSKIIYEHPAPYRKGQYGHIVRGAAGKYIWSSGEGRAACPQDWAAKMHDLERKIKPGRPPAGEVQLCGIKIKAWVADGLKAYAERNGLRMVDARKAAYAALVREEEK